MPGKQKIAIAITGASGSIYAKVLLSKIEALKEQLEEVYERLHIFRGDDED